MSRLGIGVAGLVVVAMPGCILPAIGPRKTATETLSVPVGGETTLKVDSHAGSVTVVGDADGKVTVEAVKRASTDEELATIKVELVAKGDAVELTWDRGQDNSGGKSVEFTVHVPKRMAADVKVGAGSIKLSGLEGELTVESGAGGVDLAGCRGTTRVKTAAGPIEATGVDGTLRAETSAGSIKATGTLRGDSLLKTSAGSIVVAIPSGSKLDVKATTSAGSITTDFGMTAKGIGGVAATGTLGDGSDGSLTLKTSAGSIHLKKQG